MHYPITDPGLDEKPNYDTTHSFNMKLRNGIARVFGHFNSDGEFTIDYASWAFCKNGFIDLTLEDEYEIIDRAELEFKKIWGL